MQKQFGRKVYFPDPSTSQFDFGNDLDDGDNLVVRGMKRQSTGAVGSHFDPSPASSSCNVVTPSRPVFTTKRPLEFNLKVIQATMKRLHRLGKVEFTQQCQTFIDIREDTANAIHITSMIQIKWGNDYVLVTKDGLPIEDCAGTKGNK